MRRAKKDGEREERSKQGKVMKKEMKEGEREGRREERGEGGKGRAGLEAEKEEGREKE